MKPGRFLVTMLTVLVSFVAGVITVQIVAPELLSRSENRMPEAVSARLAAAGDFTGFGDIQLAEGRAQLLDAGELALLRFTNFEVSEVPNLSVWLSRALAVDRGEEVRAIDIRVVGPLKLTQGDQAYLLPEGLNLAQYRSVLIWSDEFDEPYGVAALEP